MRRGHRKLWRDVAEAAQKVATSKNYAEEYMAGIEFTRAMTALLQAAIPRPGGTTGCTRRVERLPHGDREDTRGRPFHDLTLT